MSLDLQKMILLKCKYVRNALNNNKDSLSFIRYMWCKIYINITTSFHFKDILINVVIVTIFIVWLLMNGHIICQNPRLIIIEITPIIAIKLWCQGITSCLMIGLIFVRHYIKTFNTTISNMDVNLHLY